MGSSLFIAWDNPIIHILRGRRIQNPSCLLARQEQPTFATGAISGVDKLSVLVPLLFLSIVVKWKCLRSLARMIVPALPLGYPLSCLIKYVTPAPTATANCYQPRSPNSDPVAHSACFILGRTSAPARMIPKQTVKQVTSLNLVLNSG